jgi:phosphatidylethanolamine-binding protein (PEBP) family uncharacterized protein
MDARLVAVILDVLTVAVLALVGTRLVSTAVTAARSDSLRERWRAIVRGLRFRHFVPVPVVLTAVVVVASLLLRVPGLSWGWWTAIGGTGNVIVGGSSRPGLGAVEWIAPIVFISLLVPLLPLFAEREEHMFREGAEDWSMGRRARRAVEFGLVHLIMGIPIGVALALSVGGGYFTWAYLRGYRRGGSREAAVMESIRSHLAYNALILVVALVVVVGAAVTAVGGGGTKSRQTVLVTSSAFAPGKPIPVRYSCKGENVPPPLHWSAVPASAHVVAVAVTDPDAPGGTFVHWITVGARTELPYRGMCPPPGKAHRYVFEVLALRAPVAFKPDASPLDKVHTLEDAAVARGTLVGTFASPSR